MSRLYWLVLALVAGVSPAKSATFTNYQVLRRFGFSDKALTLPATVLQGSDGRLYGFGALGGAHNGGAIFRSETNGSSFTLLHSFSDVEAYYSHSGYSLVEAPDGVLYGTTPWGGTTNGGTLFKLNRDGSGFEVLHSFTRNNPDYEWSQDARLIAPSDGVLYGTTRDGGDHNLGSVFKINRDGSDFTLLHSFGGTTTDGQSAVGLVQGTNGLLYGSTRGGGLSGSGTVFQIATNGAAYSVLHHFTNTSGSYPFAPVMEAGDGMLYGTTESGGSSDRGTAFKLAKNGSGFQMIHEFDSNDYARSPRFGLVESPNGMLYGVTYYGGGNYLGTVYKLNRDGSGYGIVHGFTSNDGQAPMWLARGTGGFLYGVVYHDGIFGGGTMFQVNSGNNDVAVIYNFDPSGGDGTGSTARMLEGTDGVLYGTCRDGGALGGGTVFKLNRDGTGYGILHNFAAPTGNVFQVRAGLIEGADGLLYGTTGSEDTNVGNIYKLSRNGVGFTVLHTFATNEGKYVAAGLMQDSQGLLYGAAATGGTYDRGTVFRLTTNGTDFLVMHHFGPAEGAGVRSALILASDGSLYGTTAFGGTFNRGTIFKLNTNGTSFTTMHHFIGPEGREPYGSLVEGSDGVLYGTTRKGGSSPLHGTVFKINKSGSGFAVIHHFSETTGEGYWPECTLVEGADNVLYGTTSGGGDYVGTIFRLNKDGSDYLVLHRFGTIANDGSYPSGGLIKGSDRAYYGAAGKVFRLGADSATLRIESLTRLQPGIWRLGGQGVSGRAYAVQATADLFSTNWPTVGTATSSIPAGFWIFDEATTAQTRFYRAVSQ